MTRRFMQHTALALALGASLAACENATGPGAQTSILLGRDAAASLSSEAGVIAALNDLQSTSPVALAAVGAVNVSVKRVQVLPVGQDEGAEAAWITLDVRQGGSVDLMKLSESGIEIARGELPAGSYGNVRLFVEGASITFTQPVTIGGGPAARTYTAGEAHPLNIPSAAQTGIKIPTAGFVVTAEAGDVVTIGFDAAATVGSIQALPSHVQMSPVLRARE